MHRIRCFPFVPTSFFPKYGYEDILEIEFNLAKYLHYQVSGDMSFREVHWKIERLNKQIEDDNNKNNGMGNMLNNMS